jgi:hypothetical protein
LNSNLGGGGGVAIIWKLALRVSALYRARACPKILPQDFGHEGRALFERVRAQGYFAGI